MILRAIVPKWLKIEYLPKYFSLYTDTFQHIRYLVNHSPPSTFFVRKMTEEIDRQS